MKDAYLRIRQASYLPIIVVGGRGGVTEMLESGADAYVIRSLSLGELVARVRALLRRKPGPRPPGGSDTGETPEHPQGDGEDGLDGLTPYGIPAFFLPAVQPGTAAWLLRDYQPGLGTQEGDP